MSRYQHLPSQTDADINFATNKLSSAHGDLLTSPSGAQDVARLEQLQAALHAPVYKLPDEILSEVFKMHVGLSHATDWLSSLKLSWVVSRWRQVALNTSALWTTFDVSLPVTPNNRDKCKAFFGRLASRHLKLIVRVFRSRVATFGFEDPTMDFLPLLSKCDTLEIGIMFERRTLDTYYITPPRLSPGIVLPLSGLDLSGAQFRRLTDFLTLLSMCPRLQWLELTTIKLWDESEIEIAEAGLPYKPDAIALPLLTRIEMYEVEVGAWSCLPDISALFDYMMTPNLSILTLQNFEHMDGPCTSPNLTNVTTLNVHAMENVSQTALIDTICGLPALTHLSLRLLGGLSGASQFRPKLPLPPLESLNLNGSRGVDALVMWLVETTTSEGMSTGSLKVVAANSEDGVNWLRISGDVLRFVQRRVPQVQLTRVQPMKRQTALKS